VHFHLSIIYAPHFPFSNFHYPLSPPAGGYMKNLNANRSRCLPADDAFCMSAFQTLKVPAIVGRLFMTFEDSDTKFN
jgi:hypothetical protein